MLRGDRVWGTLKDATCGFAVFEFDGVGRMLEFYDRHADRDYRGVRGTAIIRFADAFEADGSISELVRTRLSVLQTYAETDATGSAIVAWVACRQETPLDARHLEWLGGEILEPVSSGAAGFWPITGRHIVATPITLNDLGKINQEVGHVLWAEYKASSGDHLQEIEECQERPRKSKGLFAVQDMAAVYQEIEIGKVTEFLLPGIIVKGGATLMTSPPGAGKTLVAMDLCAAASLPGRLWLNRYKFETPLRCLYIDEDSINGDEFNARVKAMKIPEQANIRRTMLAGIHLDDPAHEMLVLDSLSGVHRGDENSAKDMARVREGLQKICSQRITVVVLHHDTKAADFGGMSRQNRSRGSTAIPAMFTNTLHLTKDRDKKDTFAMMPGKERSRDKTSFYGLRITISHDEQENRLMLDGLPLGEDEVATAQTLLTSDDYQTRVKAALNGMPDGLNKTDLYKAVKGKKENVDEALLALGDAITVTKEGKANIYRLAQTEANNPTSNNPLP